MPWVLKKQESRFPTKNQLAGNWLTSASKEAWVQTEASSLADSWTPAALHSFQTSTAGKQFVRRDPNVKASWIRNNRKKLLFLWKYE